MRIGYGEDIHRLVEGRPLILGGVHIPFEKGLLGHSDADCLLHAVMDAILGALAEGDIGVFFPPDDPAYEGADSAMLTKQVVALMHEKGYRIENIDIMLLAERPKLNPYREQMKRSIADTLGILPSQVGLKLGTNEGLGAVGEGKAIAAKAVVLLELES